MTGTVSGTVAGRSSRSGRVVDLREQAGVQPAFDGCTWYLIESKPQGEILAMINLLRQDYRVWLPICTVVTRHARQVDARRAPFFPRYLFVGRAPGQAFAPILNTFGVTDVVRASEKTPAEVRLAHLEQVADELAKHEQLVRRPPARVVNPWKEGDHLRVTEGPFSSFAGICEMSEDQRICVLLSVFGRPTKVELRPGMVERAD